jgi:spore coat protein U-like protein
MKLRAWWMALALLLLPQLGHAAITCSSITSPGITMSYVNSTTTSVQTSFTVTCNRGSAADPSSLAYTVRVNNGLNPATLGRNKVMNGTASLIYDTYTTSGCGTQWSSTTAISDSMNWGTATGPLTRQTSYWGCITTAQTATAAGVYTDTVTMTLTYGASTRTGSLPVTIYAPAACTVSPPSQFNMTYTAFTATPSALTKLWNATCTTGMPYTIALDSTSGTVAGLSYTVGLSSGNSTGTGSAQSFLATTTIAARQAGSCAGSCSGTVTHAITVSF